jgi:NAD(P)-dependent dehydrogenase (short-subunit alcohol dehydrogenase family)
MTTTLDVLVSKAGIGGGRIGPSEATADDMRTVYDTNVFGSVRVLRAFLPLLARSLAAWSSTSQAAAALSGRGGRPTYRLT